MDDHLLVEKRQEPKGLALLVLVHYRQIAACVLLHERGDLPQESERER